MKRTKSQEVGWEKHAAGMDKNKCVYRILVEKFGGLRWRSWEDNIKKKFQINMLSEIKLDRIGPY
jgi:hypothetical protein